VNMIDRIIAGTNVEPRPYQRRIVEKTHSMFTGRYKDSTGATEMAARSILIESPTGSGKTVMAHLGAKVLQEEHPDVVFGWIAMRRNLLAQAARENKDKGINVRNIHYMSMFDKDPSALLAAKGEGKRVCLIIDEAQHDAASSCAHLHNIIEPEFILGLSATPFRTDRVKLCFDKIVKDVGIHSLIQDGYLSEFNHYTLPNWNVTTVAEHYLRDPERWGKSIFYFHQTDDCFELKRILETRGVKIDVVTGHSDRVEQLEKFHTGELTCLANCMVLTEGFDEPTLRTAWVRDSGRGCTIQMSGRAFRKHPLHSQPEHRYKQIVQSEKTRHPMIKTALPHQQFVWKEDRWLTLEVNQSINLINTNTRLAIAQTPVEIPKFITDKQNKKLARRRR